MKQVFLILIFIGMGLLAFQEPQIVTEVKSGEKQLECLFNDGWREVPAEKVVGLDDVNGAWLFTNGYATNCNVY